MSASRWISQTDGSVWVPANPGDPTHTYVITPEAVPASESADPEPSSADSPSPAACAHVTGTGVWNLPLDVWPDPTVKGGVPFLMDMRAEQQVEWSDPRLPSVMKTITNLGEHPGPSEVGFVQTWTTTHRLERPDGAWTGTGRGTNNLTEVTDGPLSFIVLTGEGAYEGLSAVLVGTGRTDASMSVKLLGQDPPVAGRGPVRRSA